MEPPKNYILSLKIIDLALHNQIYFSISGLESISVAQLVCVHQDDTWQQVAGVLYQ